MNRFAFLSLTLLVLAANAQARPTNTNFYLAPNGNDAWSGKLTSPNKTKTDGPFATLPHALEAARKVNRNNPNFAGINLTLRGGTYSLSETVTLTEKDASLHIRNYRNETARLIGGKEITGWKPVTEETVLSRMDATCRGKVFSADLKANGITETGAIVSNGWNRSNLVGPSELVFGDKPMTIARWPNTGYAQIADVPKEGGNSHFQYEGERPSRWKNADDAWVFGYWQFDWADSYVKLKSVDTAKHTLETSGIEDEFGSKKGQRWFALNLLEELDAPGEYFIDRKANVIYFWPPSPLENGKAFLSLLDKPLLLLSNTNSVVLEGLTLEGTRGEGIRIEGGERNLVAGCTFRNMGLMGVRIESGTKNTVQSCDLYDMGQGGITVNGGNRLTLEEGGNVAENNLIHDYSKWVRCYRPAIGVNGVGQKVRNNLIYEGPHTAILLSGNQHEVLRNEVHHVCKDTGDVGAFYMGRDWTMRGNKISGNYFHHLGGFKGEGFTDAMGVYLDDAASGSTVLQNIFYKAGRAVMVGGGRDNLVLNNCFVECNPSVHVDARGTGWAKDHIKRGGDWQMYEKLAAVNFDKPPYSVRYPELVTTPTNEPALPKGTRVTGNIALGGVWSELQDSLTETTAGFTRNKVEPRSPYLGLGDRQVLERVIADYPVLGLKGVVIGLKKDAYRKNLPK